MQSERGSTESNPKTKTYDWPTWGCFCYRNLEERNTKEPPAEMGGQQQITHKTVTGSAKQLRKINPGRGETCSQN